MFLRIHIKELVIIDINNTHPYSFITEIDIMELTFIYTSQPQSIFVDDLSSFYCYSPIIMKRFGKIQ